MHSPRSSINEQSESARPRSGPAPRPVSQAIDSAIDRLLSHIAERQSESGSFKGDYGGPLFLLPMYVGIAYATRDPLGERERAEMIRYLRNHQAEDGGFGLHVEGHSHVFTTALNYVALRMLGVEADDADAQRARAWLHAHGGPLRAASWGKFFLALMNLYDYSGLNPVPPELWLLPESLPVHPSRLWCHCRMVYLPMSYLYGKRAAIEVDPLIAALRGELYHQPFDRIDWAAHRNDVADSDDYTPVSPLFKAVSKLLLAYERKPNRALRRRALDFVRGQMSAEDRNTSYICIGPINKLFHTLAWYLEDPSCAQYAEHRRRLPEYLWQAEDGLKMQGYNSSELWDTAFALQAIAHTGKLDRHRTMIEAAHEFVDRNQVREDVDDREACFREPSRGGWPFSTRDHGWPITDCTAEGVKVAILLEPHVREPIAEARLTEAVDLLLWWQNPDGGWATYERTRGPAWLELLNPSNCFGEIMIDYSHAECTSASMQALATYRSRYPGRRDQAIARALANGERKLRELQTVEGAWEGFWGTCFTYGTWFGIHGLLAAGASVEDRAIRHACEFLLARQLRDGGWGELADSSRERTYLSTDEGQAVMTSWALLALIAGGRRDSEAVERGIRFLLRRQNDDGSFPEEHIAGLFNRTCAIHYDNYLEIFPLWALAEAAAE